MKKEVLISISGLQLEVSSGFSEEEEQPLEVVTPASYYYKNGKHYILYDEVTEGFHEVTKNKIRINSDSCLEIQKSGVTNSHMIFERGKKRETNYRTPYGQMLVGVDTKNLEIAVTEKRIDVRIDYELDVNGEPLADCVIKITVTEKTDGIFI